ncbi:iron transport multicopper oxidase FET3 [Plectosphaerella cucumerina]|uniref:Iron transport multicopper oxidase FET3 n=1 Tax=Plectosphaerella cucumerina TaxID=40658 RepID=A0A8K0TJB6_9PEZI|nr:iron transport multicopper oxidase FET3 [Plectosphaerella cucumerina]
MLGSLRLACMAAGLAAFLGTSQAATIRHDFTVGWVTANPDGAFDRPTIGVNGQWPLPLISANVGDRLILNVHNDLGNASTSIHFHGLFQNGTNYMDGAVGVTQCAIPPGSSFVYDFKFDQPGTYWYHAHNDGQYPEGLRGPVVVHDPNGPYEGKYDEEVVITLSDWYHQPVQTLLKQFISVENPTGAEPVPQAALMNDTQNLQVNVKPGQTYLVRLVNIGAFAAHYIWFEGHEMRVVEVDGVWVDEAPAERLYITAAQRYSVLITTKADASQNFAIVSAMDEELFDVIPDDQNSNVTGWLVYDSAKPLPKPLDVDELDAFDDFTLRPVDRQGLFPEPDMSITLDVKMDNLGDGANYAFFNDLTYVAPKVPSLYSALTVGKEHAANPKVYGTNTISHVLNHNEVIQIVLNNGDDGTHPFHLHGHNFQLVHRSEEDAGVFIDDESVKLPEVPMRRDTVMVRGNGNLVIRFRADNPGVWLFHCHIEWHMDQGLIATIIEAPAQIQALSIPGDHLAACDAGKAPSRGNAAGNTKDVLDLTGENRPPPPLPEGFTAKGYIALIASCVSAFIGLGTIAWYGTIGMGKKDEGEESR